MSHHACNLTAATVYHHYQHLNRNIHLYPPLIIHRYIGSERRLVLMCIQY